MKLYLKSGQVVSIGNELTEVSYNTYDNDELVGSYDYVDDNNIFRRRKLLLDCKLVREDENCCNELIEFYDNTGWLRFSTVMDQIIGIEED